MFSSRAVGLFLAAVAAASAADPPGLHLYPAAGQRGTTVSVAVVKFDPWPPQVWVDAPGINFKPSAKGKFDVEIASDATPGPHLVRLFNKDKASAPRFFIVSTEPELLEVEPNDDFKSPQKIAALPATISGRLDKAGDVDSFAVTLKKDQALTAWVEAYVLASTFDGMLRIVDSNGIELAFNHDGRTLDPYLRWEAPRDGTYIVQIMGFVYPATADVHLTGGEGCVYRLHLTTASQPLIQFPSPDADAGSEIAEHEPNDSIANAQAITLPCTVSGCIEKPGDEDRFAFTAEKKKSYTLKVISARAGAPLEAWLEVENKEGRQLIRNSGAEGTRDPQLTWTAPADGTFYAAIGELTHHGGPDYVYHLTVAEAVPSVTATAVEGSVVIAAGKTGEIKTTIKRANDFKAKLTLAAKNLPEGVTAAAVDVPDKDGEVVLRISAEASAVAASQPFQLVLHETESGAEHPVVDSFITTGENNGVPQGYTELVINSTNQLWLTVTVKDPPKPDAPK